MVPVYDNMKMCRHDQVYAHTVQRWAQLLKYVKLIQRWAQLLQICKINPEMGTATKICKINPAIANVELRVRLILRVVIGDTLNL